MSFEINILGSGSAVPTPDHNHSAQLIKYYNRHFLFDCGEGTQHQFRKFKLGWSKIKAIFITHLHGDHFLGLAGLLSTMSLLGHSKPVKIYAPYGLKEILLSQFKYTDTTLRFPIHFYALTKDSPETLYEDDDLLISSIPLNHGIYCNGFKIEEKQKPLSLISDLLPNDLKPTEFKDLKAGKDIFRNGATYIKNTDVTQSKKQRRSYAYISDTKYTPNICDQLEEIQVIYHESSFLAKHEDKAARTNHSTAQQASMIADQCNAKQLILGHYSARYTNMNEFLTEAQSTFPNSLLSFDGLKITLD